MQLILSPFLFIYFLRKADGSQILDLSWAMRNSCLGHEILCSLPLVNNEKGPLIWSTLPILWPNILNSLGFLRENHSESPGLNRSKIWVWNQEARVDFWDLCSCRVSRNPAILNGNPSVWLNLSMGTWSSSDLLLLCTNYQSSQGICDVKLS